MELNRKNEKIEIILPVLTITLDVIAIFISYYLSYQIRFFSSFADVIPITEGIPQIEGYTFFALSTIPVWILIFQLNKLYKLNRNVFIFDEFFQILKAVSISIIVSMGVMFFFRGFSYSRIVIIMIWIFSTFLITFFRYFTLKLEKTFYNNKIGLKNVAIVGDDGKAFKILQQYKRNVYVGFNIVGYFAREENPEMSKSGMYLGSFDKIPEGINKYDIQKLIISLSKKETDDVYTLMNLCEGINVEFMLYPNYMEIITSKLRVENIDGIPFIKLKSLPMNTWNKLIKRIFDIIFSIFMLIILSPILISIALIVKITSKGPIFYSQERIGLDHKKFNIIKFRSMITDAEKGVPLTVKKEEDRYTKIGKILRKYSLDELPQFFNVIKGDMSVVGPRPEREFFINKMKDNVTNYLERHRVKSGMTGWAQVNGYRGPETSMQTRIDYDIFYIENWSLAFDIKIIVKTLKETFFSKTAM